MPQIYFDITEVLLYVQDNNTLSGIQRVALELLRQMVEKHGTERIRVIGFHPVLERVICYDAGYFSNSFTFEADRFREDFDRSLTLSQYIHKRYGRTWKAPLYWLGKGLKNFATRGAYFKRRRIGGGKRNGPKTTKLVQTEDFRFQRGDVVFVAGGTWDLTNHNAFLAARRRADGIVIIHCIYDLIPIVAPEHVENILCSRFLAWLQHISQNADGFLTISAATKVDLDSWLQGHGVVVNSRVLPLAHQFGNARRTLTDASHRGRFDPGISAQIRNAARLPYVLCVGTIESRKNVWALANVWKSLYERLKDATPRLIFAGKHGWLKQDFDNFLHGTGSLYGYIRVVDRPSDADLEFLYRSCLFSVYVSYMEGWGLPIGECLWFGRPVVCSNVSSMPEVGGSLVEYADPTSHASIEAAVSRLITDVDYRERRAAEIAAAHLRTWGDVADDLWSELNAPGG